jgi:RNA polymerase sigma factor (TIGR02999 family)
MSDNRDGMSDPAPITRLLQEWSAGEDEALERLVPLVYKELRRLARHHMGRERQGHTLQPTALVSEAFLRLLGIKQVVWQDREHFFAVAARLMRRILVDSARARGSHKRGDGIRPVSLDGLANHPPIPQYDLLPLDEALLKLEGMDTRKARVVELRVFMGLSVEEAAVALGVSSETVKRDWRLAKAWLSAELQGHRP